SRNCCLSAYTEGNRGTFDNLLINFYSCVAHANFVANKVSFSKSLFFFWRKPPKFISNGILLTLCQRKIGFKIIKWGKNAKCCLIPSFHKMQHKAGLALFNGHIFKKCKCFCNVYVKLIE